MSESRKTKPYDLEERTFLFAKWPAGISGAFHALR